MHVLARSSTPKSTLPIGVRKPVYHECDDGQTPHREMCKNRWIHLRCKSDTE